MAVRTARLAVDTSNVGSQKTIYTCPSGKTAILKDVRVYADGGAATRVILYLIRSGGAPYSALMDQDVGNQDTVAWQGFIVLEPGDHITFQSTGNAARAWLSGAELDGVAP